MLLAFSGGLDSRVLLDLLADLRLKSDFHLDAMHVHHGLSPNADDWSAFCSETCAHLGVPIQIARVNVQQDSGMGLEAAARSARYRALMQEMENLSADYVVLAHHQDDQAETLLLQLLRGAGAKGLSGMAGVDKERHLLRPLLNFSRAELLACAGERGLRWIEDESNQILTIERNYLRHEILPVLEERFPAVKTTLARSASNLAEASQLLNELAEIDAAGTAKGQQLDLVSLSSLSDPRARNLLRWWLSVNQVTLPSAARLQEMLRQLLDARPDAKIKVAVDAKSGVWLRRYRGFAYVVQSKIQTPVSLTWQGEAELRLPDNSRLIFQRKMGEGLADRRLGINELRVSYRIGGERFKPDPAKPTRTLKHLLQEANIPPWQRERLPLIYSDDSLAVVPGIGIASHLQASNDEVGLLIIWQQG